GPFPRERQPALPRGLSEPSHQCHDPLRPALGVGRRRMLSPPCAIIRLFSARFPMFGDWFKVKEVDEFADSIVADLVKRFPPSQVESPGKKAAEKLRKT